MAYEDKTTEWLESKLEELQATEKVIPSRLSGPFTMKIAIIMKELHSRKLVLTASSQTQ